MTGRLGIADIGLATPFGVGKSIVAASLFKLQARMTERADLIPGRVIQVGAVTADLPEVPDHLAGLSCRNNRLVLAALAELRPPVEAAVKRYGRARIAVVAGTSTSGISDGETAFAAQAHNGGNWPPAFHYRQQETGGLGEFIARTLGLEGPAYTISTACSSSGKVFASARRLIAAGFADAVVVGGADTLCRMTAGGFASLEALSSGHCNPFSANRDGINIGEGAAFFLLTPEPAVVELAGIGETSDAHHVSAPDPTGRGARDAMTTALADASLAPDAIGYLNLHGTGTALNDVMEGNAVHAVFGADVPVSSTKAMTGHMLGAAAAGEAAFLWLTLHRSHNPDGRLPAHLWDGVRDSAIADLAYVTGNERIGAGSGAPFAALSNSFAFGGSNIALVLARGSAS
jgi:3-oxoacyl-[acyl-carrier-protein] synthase I